jgi:hypothetical protein
MRLLAEQHDRISLSGRLHDAPFSTAVLLREVMGTTSRRSPRPGQAGIQAKAWTEAALALNELELPQWQLPRIAYDGGEWHCALSRQRELPDWLDQSSEASHRIWHWRSFAHWSQRKTLPVRPTGPAFLQHRES